MTAASTGRASPSWRIWRALGAALIAAASLGAPAAQKSASFIVSVDLFAEDKTTGECDRTTSPASPSTLFIKCGTSKAPAQPDTRFMLNVYMGSRFLGSIDSMMSTGTVTSWRVINLGNRDYLEIMIGW